MRAKLALFGLTLGVATAVGISCADKPAVGLMIAIQTDLSVTKDFDQLGLYITADGVPILTQTYQIEGSSVRLPSTIAIAPPKNENAVIRVRVVAFKTDAAKVLREGITTVPRARLAVLPLPLKWINTGSTKGTEAEFQVNPFAANLSLCPDKNTKINGLCTTSSIAVEKLDDYVPSEIFGGADSPSDGSCFDTKACFTQRVEVPVDESKCTIPKLAGATNVAVSTSSGEGEPVGQDTLIALDETDYGVTGNVIQLPSTLCDPNGLKPQRKAIVVSTTCETKKAKYPVCGPYSTGKPLPPLGDAGVLEAGPDSGNGIEMIGASEPSIGALTIGSGYVYGVGADPNDAGAFRILGYPLVADSGAPFFLALNGPPPDEFQSTALALSPDGGDLGVVRASNVSGTVELYSVTNAIPNPSPATANHPLPFPILASSAKRLYSVAGIFDPDGGSTFVDLISFDKSSLSEPLIVMPQVDQRVTSMVFTTGPDVVFDSGGSIGYLFAAAAGNVIRVTDPEGSLSADPSFVPATVSKTSEISALAVSPSGKLVIAGLNGTALTINVGDAFASTSLAKLSLIPVSANAPPTDGAGTRRYYGIATDAKYVYFAHDAGIDYAALDGSGQATRLVTSPGIYSLATDAKYLYWTQAKVGSANPQAQGFFRHLLVP